MFGRTRMAATVVEPKRDIEVIDDVDVLVVGGGVAGCAAACAAGRAGAKTVLLEREGCLGGVATASLMANIGNVYLNAVGDQVVHGFAGEVVDRLIEAGAATPTWRSRDVPGCVMDSERLKIVLIGMLRDADVTVLTHALGARPIMEGNAVRGAYVESKSGRQAIRAAATVDATGEADLAWQAGAAVEFGGGTASLLFKLANVQIDAFVDFLTQDPDGFPAKQDYVKSLDTFLRNWRERGILFFPHGGGRAWPFMQDAIARGEFCPKIGDARNLDALGMYGLKGDDCVVINSNFYKIEDLDVRTLSNYELHAQEMCYYVGDFMRRRVPGFGRSHVAHIGVANGIRASRMIRGRSTLAKDVSTSESGPVYADDVVGVMPVWDHAMTCGEFVKSYTYDIPFGITVPDGCTNLVVASGKSVSTERIGMLRSMVGCMICGQAAGGAAAIASRVGGSVHDVSVRDLQRALLAQNVYLGEPDRLKQLDLPALRGDSVSPSTATRTE